MLTVIKVDCSANLLKGYAALNKLLARSREGASRFEADFPTLNGSVHLYSRLVGTFRDLSKPDSILLAVEEGTEKDCEALSQIVGIAACSLLTDSAETVRWDKAGFEPTVSDAMHQYWGPEGE